MINFARKNDAALQVTEYNSFAELQGLRTQWASLVAQTRNATFFQHFDWLETYWQHYGQDQRLRVLVVTQNNQPIGILPLVVRQRSLGWGSARVLAYPLDDWGTFYGPIGPEPLATLRAGLKHIAQTQRDWDFVELGWVASETGDEGHTGAALAAAGLAGERSFYDSVAIVDLVGTWHEYLAARPNRFRSKLAAAERKLAGRGKVTYERFRPEPAGDGPVDYRWDLYDACVEISRQSWQADSDNGTTMCHEQVSNYLRDAHMAAVRAGCCDLNILFVDGRPAAFMYCYTYRGRVFGLRRGFDASVARDGLGTVLCARMLEDSFARGDREVDMGASYLESKRVWMTRLVPSDRYTHFPSRKLKAQVVRIHRAARGWWSAARGESAVGSANPKAAATRT